MRDYYVAVSKRCERALTVQANSDEEAAKIALAELRAEGDYDEWHVDEAYTVKHHATANRE